MKLIGIERWSYREPPRFKRIFPPEIPGATSDWDFGSTYWQLDTSTYVSAPSSLKVLGVYGIQPTLCKYTGTTNISQGQIASYIKAIYNWGNDNAPIIYFYFRNQSSVGSNPSTTNGYIVGIGVYSKKADIYKPGGSLYLSTSLIAYPTDATQWNKYRVTWWTDPGGAGLMIRLEYWGGSQWVKMINDVNYPSNQYASSSINRVGIGAYNNTVWFDDTEIWSA